MKKPTHKSCYLHVSGVLLSLFLLGGCAQSPSKKSIANEGTSPTTQNSAPKPTAAARATATKEQTLESEEALPFVPLTADIVYQLLVAEIAQQRGQIGLAYNTFFQTAERTRDPRLARRAAELAVYSRDMPRALEATRLWNELATNNSSAQFLLISLLVVNGKIVEAEPRLQAFLQTELSKANNATARSATYEQLVRWLQTAPDKKSALSLAERLLNPQDSRARFALAQLATQAEDGPRALSEAQAASKLEPTWAQPVLLQAQILPFVVAANANPDATTQAQNLLEHFLRDQPDANDVRLQLIRLMLKNPTPATTSLAKTQLIEVLKRDQHNAQAQYTLALVLLEEKNYAFAEQALKRYLNSAKETRDGRDIDQAYLALGQIAEAQNKTAEALEWYAQIDDGEQALNALVRRAQLLAKNKQLDAARQLLRSAEADTERERVQLIAAESTLLREAKQDEAAFKVLDDALRELPDQTDLLYEHGMAAERINRLDVMEKSFRRVIQLRPKDAHAYNALGYSLADRHLRLPEALQLIEKALQLQPDDPAILDSMGWVQFRLGHISKALEYLQRAYNKWPDAEIASHLGEVLWQQGKQAEARQIWQAAQQKQPDHESLRNTLQRLGVKLQ